jgi:hypothetical protein
MSAFAKTFDAVAFQRKRREEIDIQSETKSFKERKSLIKTAAERFRNHIKSIKTKKDS